MNKNEMAASVGKTLKLSKKKSIAFASLLFEAMKEELSKGNKVIITDFGSFVVKERVAHTGIVPGTGEKIEIPATKTVRFKPFTSLKKDINK